LRLDVDGVVPYPYPPLVTDACCYWYFFIWTY